MSKNDDISMQDREIVPASSSCKKTVDIGAGFANVTVSSRGTPVRAVRVAVAVNFLSPGTGISTLKHYQLFTSHY